MDANVNDKVDRLELEAVLNGIVAQLSWKLDSNTPACDVLKVVKESIEYGVTLIWMG